MTVSRTPRVALYGRVSTADQRADLQLDALRALAAQRQWTVHEEYCDAGYSGTKDRRPALDRLMADARRGKFGVVAAMSQFEAELIRERTVAGLAAARRRGVRLGRRPVRIDMDRARELRGRGLSFRQLALELGVSVGVVHRLLTSDGGVHQSSSAAASGTA